MTDVSVDDESCPVCSDILDDDLVVCDYCDAEMCENCLSDHSRSCEDMEDDDE